MTPTAIRADPKKRKNPVYPNMAKINPPMVNHRTFATFRIILSGLADALLSISFKFFFFAYSEL